MRRLDLRVAKREGWAMRRRRCAVVLSLLLVGWISSAPAVGFGRIDGGGQHREHERITRRPRMCELGVSCFEPATMDYLAGHTH
jgi:hypothetical protein